MLGTVGGLDAGTIDIKTAYIKGTALIVGLVAMYFLDEKTAQDFGE